MAKVRGQRGKSKKDRDAAAAEDMKKAAAGEAPRLNLPTPRDLKHHYQTIAGYKAQLDEANGRLRNAFKQAEEAGVDCAAIRFAMSKSKKDPMVLKVFLQQAAEHLKELGLPFQISLFDTLKGTPDEQAYKQGFEVGEGGKTPNNPYPEGSSPYKQYARGVSHGIGKNLGQTPEQVDAALASGGDDDAFPPAPSAEGDGKQWPDDADIAKRDGEQAH